MNDPFDFINHLFLGIRMLLSMAHDHPEQYYKY